MGTMGLWMPGCGGYEGGLMCEILVCVGVCGCGVTVSESVWMLGAWACDVFEC